MRSIFYQDFPHIEHDGKVPSREAEYAREQLKESLKWDEVKGKYLVGLPYKFGREKTAEILSRLRINGEEAHDVSKKKLGKEPGKKAEGFFRDGKVSRQKPMRKAY